MSRDTDLTNIFDKISELFIDDIDNKDSAVNKLMDEITLNIIITTLDSNKRVEFYAHLMSKKYEDAKDMILKEIPNLNYLVFSAVTKVLNS